jgi:acetyltransferase-like isoleucine patch superfamily enzyme
MLNPHRLYFYNILRSFLPETRSFDMKRRLLRWCGAEIGLNVRICSSVVVRGVGNLKISSDTWIGHDVRINSGACVCIGRCVDIGPQVFIGTGTHQIDPLGDHSAGQGKNLDIIIDDGVWLGAGSLILPGVTIGRKAVVAAGAVVTKNVPEMSLVAGVPAVVKRNIGLTNRSHFDSFV